jgi:hypothetical protein
MFYKDLYLSRREEKRRTVSDLKKKVEAEKKRRFIESIKDDIKPGQTYVLGTGEKTHTVERVCKYKLLEVNSPIHVFLSYPKISYYSFGRYNDYDEYDDYYGYNGYTRKVSAEPAKAEVSYEINKFLTLLYHGIAKRVDNNEDIHKNG